jgi:hypothetical protein
MGTVCSQVDYVRSLGLDTKDVALDRLNDLDDTKKLLFLGTFPATHVSTEQYTVAARSL